MSLLEDIFLGDEANEAQELERVIDGDEYDDRPRSEIRSPSNSDDNSEKEDEAEEDKRRVDPTNQKAKRVVKNPRFILNPARLIGPRGIQVIPEQFKDFKFKGKGHEKDDLDIVLKKLEHWAYRLYPKYQFEDCLKKIETLGKKQPVKVHLHRIRTDQLLSHETVVQKDSSDDEKPDTPQEEDEFDKLLQQQIELARATPAPGSVKKGFMTPAEKTFAASRATSSPSINDEQRERMLRNRQLAEERRLAKIKANNSANVTIDLSESQQQENTRIVEDNEVIDITEPGLSKTATHIEKSTTIDLTEQYSVETTSRHTISNAEDIIVLYNEVVKPRIVKRSNVIDSSDDECDVIAVNQSVSVDIHADFGASNNTQNLDSINKADIVSDNSNINTDITDDGGMEICTEPIDTVQDNMGANVKDVSSGDSISNTNVDTIGTENADMSNKNNEDIRTEHSGNNSEIDSTEVSGSTNTEDISAANNENIANSNDVNIANTEDNIVNNEVKSNAQLEDIEVSENDILTVTNKDIEIKNSDDSILKHNDDTFEKDKAEQNLITCENGKAKNIDLEINKENVEKNIVPNQNINEELMDVDFSEEF